MSKYYVMAEKALNESTIIYKKSHKRIPLKTGCPLPKDFKGPLICKLDEEHLNGIQPTFYMSPAIIGTRQFHQDLLDCGVDNIDAYEVVIKDELNDKQYNDHVLLNIIGRVSCADMTSSEVMSIGDGMNIIDKLVIDKDRMFDYNMFLVHEDTDCIVINEQVYKYLNDKGYKDIYFEEIEVV